MIAAFHRRPDPARQAGFTLLEVIIVIVIIGLALGLVLTRGPMRSRTLEMQAAVNQVVQGLRTARSRAIAGNTLPRSLSIAVTAVSNETIGNRAAAIRFNPDGSATGGRIDITDGQRATQIGVDWLTGRVSVAQLH